MIELRTLGTIDLRADSAGRRFDALLAQPKRISLLTYVVVAEPRGFQRRDTLLALFWPDASQSRARAALNQAVYVLRRSLGEHVILARGDDEIGVDATAVRCDAVAFRDAIRERGRESEGLERYQGDFLAGFHLDDAPNFERWADEERAQLKREAVKAATELAQRDRDAGNSAGAAHWLTRAATIAPYDEPIVRDLIHALTTAGDRPGAIREYEAFAARLSRDLELEPSEEVSAFIEELRASPNGAQRIHDSDVAFVMPSAPTDARDGPSHAPPNAGPARLAARPRHRGLVVGVAAVLVLLIGGLLSVSPVRAGLRGALGRGDARGLLPNRVIVMPLQNLTGDSSVTTLGRMAADWVTQSLQRTGLLEVIDPVTAFHLVADVDSVGGSVFDTARLRDVAAAARAGTVVWGSVSQQSGDLLFQVKVIDARDGKVLRTLEPIAADSNNIRQTLEVLRTRVAGALATMFDERLATIVASSSPPPSFEAYQEFARGMDRFKPGGYQEAYAHFERAARLDTTFIMARFWAIYAIGNTGQLARRDSLITSLLPLRHRLPPADGAGLDMFAADMRNDFEAALRAARRAAQLAPQSSWRYMAGSLAERLGRPREALAELAQLDPTRGWLKGWPGYWAVRVAALHKEGKYEEELAVVRLALRTYLTGQSLGLQQFHISEGRALAALGRLRELGEFTAAQEASYSRQGARGAAFLHYVVGLELSAHGFPAESRAYFERCIGLYKPMPPEVRTAEASCLFELGRAAEASAAFGSIATTLAPLFNPGLAAARLGHREEAERVVIGMIQRPFYKGPGMRQVAAFEQARIAALTGQRERAVELLRDEPLPGLLRMLLHLSPDFDSIKDDPTVAELFRSPAQKRLPRLAAR